MKGFVFEEGVAIIVWLFGRHFCLFCSIQFFDVSSHVADITLETRGAKEPQVA